MLDEKAKMWLAEHFQELPPEELPSEIYCGKWPIIETDIEKDIFAEITSQREFNEIIGNPKNWDKINKDIYEKWIFPNAVILFGKFWFDKIKWKNSIHRGIDFPLFSKEEKNYAIRNKICLEDTPAGRSIIAKIISKISYTLTIYLEGKWVGKFIKKPGGYIIDSLKNEFVKEIGTELGYKSSSVLSCPYCLSNTNKTPLIHNGSKQFSCPKCDNLSKNINNIKDVETKQKFRGAHKFKNFIGITCICPSNNCKGHFVPLNCIDFDLYKIEYKFENEIKKLGRILKTINVSKNINSFSSPPNELLNLPLECPYCYTKFTIHSALKSKSGFKNKSGFFTGLPSVKIWEKKCVVSLDQKEDITDMFKKNCIVENYFNIDEQILYKEKINILIDEIIIYMSKINKNIISGLITWYFLKSSILWMIKYWKEAVKYFFDGAIKERDMSDKEKNMCPGKFKKKMTVIPRAKEISIHQSLFYFWMNVLEQHINEFTKIDNNIKSLKDFKWFCRVPKFSGGPESMFKSSLNFDMKIANKTNIINKTSDIIPRIVKVNYIYKIENNIVNKNVNYINDVKFYDWQSITIKSNLKLQPGDDVIIVALMMDGHPTHSPIQRILRLRKKVLSSIIRKIKNEELAGECNIDYWLNRKNTVIEARKITGINLTLKEQ